MNGTTQCSGDDPSPSNVPNTTCVVEWYYARSGGNLPPSTLQIQPVWLNGTPSRHVIPRERMRVEESSQAASFILCWFFIQRRRFLHSAGAPVGMTERRYVFWYYREQFRPFGPERHTGRSLWFRWWVDSFNRTGCIRDIAGGRLPPLHARWWVIPFIRTGCIRHVPWRWIIAATLRGTV